MNYISDKVNELTGSALSEVRNRWIHRQAAGAAASESSAADANTTTPEQIQSAQTTPASRLYADSPLSGGIPFGGDSYSRRGGAFPAPPPIGFRTDLLLSPDLTGGHYQKQTHQLPPVGGPHPHLHHHQTHQPDDSTSSAAHPASLVAPQGAPFDVSSESLYEGDAWSRLWFQRVLILCLLRLLLFIRKVYEDYQATKVYNLTGQRGHFVIAATTLFMPTIVFTIYRVSRYLQLTLPPLRNRKQAENKQQTERRGDEAASSSVTTSNVRRTNPDRAETSRNEEDLQLRRALMSSPHSEQSMGGMSTPINGGIDDEGLVTARQTPTNMDEFHDSKSQQDASGVIEVISPLQEATHEATAGDTQVPPPRPPRPAKRSLNGGPSSGVHEHLGCSENAAEEEKLESVKVDKLGNLPDRDTVRIAIGASEQLLHGVLFIFWQLKRQVDVMGYLVERACLWRRPAAREKEELNRMNCHRDGLEWFQDFYAAFLAILAQVYTLGLHWSDESAIKHLKATQLNAATSGLSPTTGLSSSPDGASDGAAAVSGKARVISNLLSAHAISLAGKDVLLMSELIVSIGVVVSLLICVRRRDDGPLTLGLSMLGWGSLFAARIIIIALAFVHIGWYVMLPLVALHVLCITGWIYKIALDSHNQLASELHDEAKWDEEAANEQSRQQEAAALELTTKYKISTQSASLARRDVGGEDVEADHDQRRDAPPLSSDEMTDDVNTGAGVEAGVQQSPQQLPVGPSRKGGELIVTHITSSWSLLEHLVLLSQILTLFAIPSLFYWPIMFNLKLHLRPFKYLVLILMQNFLLIPAIWFTISARATATPGQLYLLGAVGAFSIVGFIFVSLYVACKPSLTEYFARADELFNEADKSGIYYEFCSRVFRMPDLSRGTFKRLMNQTEALVEEVTTVVEG